MQKEIIRRPLVDDNNLPNTLHPIIKQIYARRGIKNEDELSLNLPKLLPLELLSGLKEGCEILFDAFAQQKKIFVVGDFDADGATSTALMMEALTLLGSTNHHFIVPNRFEYGYGLTPEIVDIAHARGAELIITVDNGISCIAGVTTAKALGLQVIVTDHHLQGEQLPPADAIINPNQHVCNFPSKALAGVGVAFYFMMAFRKHLRELGWYEERQMAEPNLAQLLDLVALGTVADVVPLDYNNRILVEQGIKRIRAGVTRPGIQALLEVANKTQAKLIASDFGFSLGPRINAAGRLDDMSFGINCLLASDLSTARAMAVELDGLNQSRREIEQGIQQEAERVLSQLSLTHAKSFASSELPNAISLFQPDWHQGVIGIVAGRLKEKFNRPSIVFAASDTTPNELKGSARSIIGLHIRDLLEHIDSQNPGVILKFGGHAMAAGLTIQAEHFEQFSSLFNQVAGEWLSEEDFQGKVFSDGVLGTEHLTLSFAQQLQDAGPWGQQFPEPVFDDHFNIVQQRIVGEKHLKLVVEKNDMVFDAIAFNVDLSVWPSSETKQVSLAYKLDINEFRGKQTVQFMVEHIAPC
ncbi:single-stranded-DNA-specific exonuclease RecJ [Thalassotalea atypica]|uniref:single-stranded-DNA-specific exonuclease RecJ n=1 Tax=Thalassotalea atypica TaxID=2054316 RepID=UPI002573958B|nr:single-stranded-DNA-specific exonuclease RecJ [Thalassotalea atypica]